MKKILFCIVMLFCCIIASAQTYVYSVASDGYTNIRTYYSTNSAIIGELRNGGGRAIYLAKTGSWYKINYNGTIGYVHKSQVRLSSGSSSSSSTARYVYSSASDGYTNIRSYYSTNSAIIGELQNGGSGARYLGSTGKWYKVNYHGTIGYVHKSQVYIR